MNQAVSAVEIEMGNTIKGLILRRLQSTEIVAAQIIQQYSPEIEGTLLFGWNGDMVKAVNGAEDEIKG